MPVAFPDTPVSPPREVPPRKRWTREECKFLDSLGFWENKRLELIEGELIEHMGKNRPHSRIAKRIFVWLEAVFGAWRVDKEEPIDVAPEDNPTSEPVPDIVVLRESSDQYKINNPHARDVLLVLEVADSTLSFDLATKAHLYARAGIPDYWVVDIANRRFIVHREPAEGRYASIAAYGEDESVAPLAAPESALALASIFGE